jgi:hypothetical protein
MVVMDGGFSKDGETGPLSRPNADRRDDDFEIEIRIEKPIPKPIDKADSAFNREILRHVGGINTAPSVFSRDTLFNVTEENSPELPKEPYGVHSDR